LQRASFGSAEAKVGNALPTGTRPVIDHDPKVHGKVKL
jgi:hypothetical protein